MGELSIKTLNSNETPENFGLYKKRHLGNSSRLPLRTILIYFLTIVLFELMGDWLWYTNKFMVNWAPFMAMTAGIVIVNHHFWKSQISTVTRRKVFKYGMRFCMMTMVLLIIYRLFYFTVLFPEIKLNLISDTETEISQVANISKSEIAFAVKMIDRVFLPSLIFGSMLTSLVSGILGSVISVCFERRIKAR